MPTQQHYAHETSQEMKQRAGLFGRFFRRKKKTILTAANRRHARYPCSCIGKVSIGNRALTLDGLVTEVALGGIKFRPAKVYLLDMRGVQVSIEFGGMKVVGKIVATRPDGYGIAFFDQLEENTLDELVSEFGIENDED